MRWIHKSCVGMLTAEYNDLANTSTPWYCPDCGTPHQSDVIDEAPASDSSSVGSKYSSFSEGEPLSPDASSHNSTTAFSDTSIHSVDSPAAASSPKARNQYITTARKSLRLLTINFQSIRKKGRNIDLLVETTKPDVILGTETWLSQDIPSSYFFNSALGYKVHRRDRPQDPHGGVLLAVKDDIEVLDVERHKELELITGTIKVGQKKMILGSYYRPPDKTDEDYLTSVQSEFIQLKKKSKNAIFILGGDFNVPDIDWTTHKISGTSYPQRVSQTFLDITMELGLEQLVDFPTKLENTLNLIFTSHPSFKIRCKPLPPIGQKSDHDIVLLDTAHQPLRARPPRRKIFLWKRADAEKMKQHLKEFSHSFMKETSQTVECMWTLFRSAITSAVEKHVPTKMSSTRQTRPWVNTSLRRAMRRKQRAHWRSKKTKKHKDWNRYKKLQAAVQRET